jgi:CheY-like chemotaxis protein
MSAKRRATVAENTTALIVDDETFSRFMAAEMLEGAGISSTLTARTGAEALEVLSGPEAHRIGVVLLDFHMPPPNGIEVLKAIRSGRLAVAHDVVVLLVSGVEGFGLVAAAVALDVDGFLFKPVGVDGLRNLLSALEREEHGIQSPRFYAEIDVDGLSARLPAFDSAGGVTHAAVADLVPGMRLVADLRGPDGQLLVAAGTQVTDRLVRLLRGLVAAGLPVAEVAVSAPA